MRHAGEKGVKVFRTAPRPALIVFVLIALSACGTAAGTNAWMASPAVTNASSSEARLALAATPAVASMSNGATVAPRTSASRSPSARATLGGASPMAVPGVTATSTAGGATSGGVVYGIADPEILGDSSLVQTLEAMKALGATTVRFDASWYWGQPTETGGFQWAPLDRVFAALKQVGMSADLDINQTPTWAGVAGADQNPWAAPASPAAFAAWAGAVASRYGPQGAKYFEIWNEPNTQGAWEPQPDPAAYTAVLKAAYSAIKAADPSAIVLTGGLAPVGNTATSYDPRTFLEDMYADGAEGSFDGVGAHPYSYPATPDEFESWSGWSEMSQTSPSLRSIMAENGDSAKKIWITEYGAPTLGADSVGEAGQETELVQAIAQVKDLSWVGSFFIYTWADLTTDTYPGFGLLTSDDTEKPAYSAVAGAMP